MALRDIVNSPCRQSELTSCLSRLQEVAGGLDDSVNSLEAKLQPVMRQEPEKPCENAKEQSSSVKYAQELNALASRLEGILNRIRSVNGKLEV